MDELLAELAPEFGAGQGVPPQPRRPLQRRQVAVQDGTGGDVGDGGYIQFSAEGLGAGSGMWIMAPDQLDRYRRAVADDGTGAELVEIVDRSGRPRSRSPATTSLKTAPKGYPKDHPRIELLRYKGLIAWKEWPAGAWLGKKSAKDRVVDVPPHHPSALRLVGHQRRRLDAPARHPPLTSGSDPTGTRHPARPGTPTTRLASPPMARPRPTPPMTSSGVWAPTYIRPRPTRKTKTHGTIFQRPRR